MFHAAEKAYNSGSLMFNAAEGAHNSSSVMFTAAAARAPVTRAL